MGGISPEVTSPMNRSPPGLALNAENAWVGVLKNRSPAARDSAFSVAMALPTTPDPKRPELSPLSSAPPPPDRREQGASGGHAGHRGGHEQQRLGGVADAGHDGACWPPSPKSSARIALPVSHSHRSPG